MTDIHHPGAADGDDFTDICKAGVACPCCALWAAPGEDRAAWLARVGQMYHAAPFVIRPGTALNAARLTVEQVRAIRSAHPNGASGTDENALAAAYGVGRMTIRDVLARRTWVNV